MADAYPFGFSNVDPKRKEVQVQGRQRPVAVQPPGQPQGPPPVLDDYGRPVQAAQPQALGDAQAVSPYDQAPLGRAMPAPEAGQLPPPPSEQQQLQQLQQHGLGVGGAPQQGTQIQVSQAPPPVQITPPSVKVPDALPQGAVRLPGGDFRVGSGVYGNTGDYYDTQRNNFMNDLHSSGLRGLQQGIYNPFASPEDLSGQQRASYGQGQSAFLQAMASQSDDEKLALNRQLGLGDLAVKKGGLDVESQKAAAQQASDRARIASGENVAQGEITSKEGIAGRENTSREGIAKLGVVGNIEVERMKAQAETSRALAQQNAMNKGALSTTLAQANAALIAKGGPQAQQYLDRIQAINDQLHGGQADPSLFSGLNPDPRLMQWLGGGLNIPGYGQGQVQVQGSPSAVQVNGGQAKRKTLADIGQDMSQSTPQESINERLGITPANAQTGQAAKLGPLKDMGVKGVLEKLGDFDAGRISPEDMDHVVEQMLNSGMTHDEIRQGLAREHVRLSRGLGDEGGRYKFKANHGTGGIEISTPDGGTLRGAEGNFPVIGPYMSRTSDLIPMNITRGSDQAYRQRRNVAELMMDRYLQAHGGRK